MYFSASGTQCTLQHLGICFVGLFRGRWRDRIGDEITKEFVGIHAHFCTACPAILCFEWKIHAKCQNYLHMYALHVRWRYLYEKQGSILS